MVVNNNMKKMYLSKDRADKMYIYSQVSNENKTFEVLPSPER